MKTRGILYSICTLLLVLITPLVYGQSVDLEVVINSGNSTTTCTDPTDDPEPRWGVNISNQGYVTYPDFCGVTLPNSQYLRTETCPRDFPDSIQVCFRAFENDGALCDVVPECSEEICQNFPIPAFGGSDTYTLGLEDGLSSDGEVNFTITLSDLPAQLANDDICGAIDLGVIGFNEAIGDTSASVFSNVCATRNNELNPQDQGGFFNDAGVWFTFTTDANPVPVLVIDVISDPSDVGDDINSQIAVYQSDSGDCTGNFDLIRWADGSGTPNSQAVLFCPDPNTTYHIMVDGAPGFTDPFFGTFGLQVSSPDINEGADQICDAPNLGVVPDGATLEAPGLWSNFCATSIGDPFVPAFQVQVSVWFQFIAPASGHVNVRAFEDTSIFPLNPQIAVFQSSDMTCTGQFMDVGSVFTGSGDENLELSCLNPGEPYWILIDGFGTGGIGIFDIEITDLGDQRSRFSQDLTLCFGDSLVVGSNVYQTTGLYIDTLLIPFGPLAGCDSIVTSNLVVLEDINITLTQTVEGIGLGVPNAAAEVSVTGGTGNYTYSWCNGETGPEATALEGGSECCITVTDDLGCEQVACLDVLFTTIIIPEFENDTLDCFGDMNGVLQITASNGVPPYNYTWENSTNTLNGSGFINPDGLIVEIPALPADTYTITIADAYSDTTFIAEVVSPDELIVNQPIVQDASCFSFCDGSIDIQATGGTGTLEYLWSEGVGNVSNPTDLCAGIYSLSVVDENGCFETLEVEVQQPDEFIASVIGINPVSCFGGMDGAAQVITNGNPIQFAWSTGQASSNISDLAAGIYTVTVTNVDQCLDTLEVVIEQPDEPLRVQIEEGNPISCFEESDGQLDAIISGPGTSISYSWNTGGAQSSISNLSVGEYSVSVINENGCEADAQFFLTQPDAINAELLVRNLNCLDGPNGGALTIDTVTGGVGNFEYSLDGIVLHLEQ